MTENIGIDIVKIDRVKKAAQSPSFWRVFTAAEKEYINSKADKFSTMAGLFAAKEAVAKALGRGFKNIRPDALEVLHDDGGCPFINIEGKTISLSISHDGDYAAAAAYLKVELDKVEPDLAKQSPHGQGVAPMLSAPLLPAPLLIDKLKEIIPVAKQDAVIPARDRLTHKGDYASVFIIGGSGEMPGAPLMAFESAVAAKNAPLANAPPAAHKEADTQCPSKQVNIVNNNVANNADLMHSAALAALKSGAGLVRLCVPEGLKAAYQARVKQEMLVFLPDIGGRVLFDAHILDMIIKKADSIVIGPGMGENPEIIKIIEYLCKKFDKTLIVDADALNSLAHDLSVLKGHSCRLILTPHIGEFLRLTGMDKAIKTEKKANADIELAYKAADFALNHDCTVVLKSAHSFITDGVRIYKNTTGTAAMAKGGSGDVLAGLIAALSGFMTPLAACIAACYHLGKNGEAAENQKGAEGVLAEDLYLK